MIVRETERREDSFLESCWSGRSIFVGVGWGGEESLEAGWPGMLDPWTPQVGFEL